MDNTHATCEDGAAEVVDIHICGACRTQFNNVDLFLVHKRQTCPALNRGVKQTAAVTSHHPISQRVQQVTQEVRTSTANHHAVPQTNQVHDGQARMNMVPSYQSQPTIIAQPLGHEYIRTSAPVSSQPIRGVAPVESNNNMIENSMVNVADSNLLNASRTEQVVFVNEESGLQVVGQDCGLPRERTISHQMLVQTQSGQQLVSIQQQSQIPDSVAQSVDQSRRGQQDFQSGISQSFCAPDTPSQPVPVNIITVSESGQLQHLVENPSLTAGTIRHKAPVGLTFTTVSQLQSLGHAVYTVPSNQSLLQITPSSSSNQQTIANAVPRQIHIQGQMFTQEALHHQQQLLQEQTLIHPSHVVSSEGGHLDAIINSSVRYQQSVSSSAGGQHPQTVLIAGGEGHVPSAVSNASGGVQHVQSCLPLATQSSVDGSLVRVNLSVAGSRDLMAQPQQSLQPVLHTEQKSAAATEQSPVKQASAAKPRPTPSKKFRCTFPDCAFTSAYMKDVDRHNRTHTGERPFVCNFCGKAFNRQDKLRLHQRAHTGLKPYKCNQCSYSAVDGSSLRKHRRVHTDERPFKCQVCPYASRNSSQLVVHLRTHTGDSPFQCPVCHAKFKINSDLKRHLRIHTGEKPYTCYLCNYKCSIKGNLKTHFRINHSEQNLIECEHCEFKTSSRKALKEHQKFHKVERVVRCVHCVYQCTSYGALRNHLRTHSSERPFQCEYCSYSCKQNGNLKVHIRRKHPDMVWLKKKMSGKKTSEPEKSPPPPPKESSRNSERIRHRCQKAFACHLCDAAFVREDSLRSHVRQHKEMANSSLSTALTVLRLQQPVINQPAATTASSTNSSTLPIAANANRTQTPEIVAVQNQEVSVHSNLNPGDMLMNVPSNTLLSQQSAIVADMSSRVNATTPVVRQRIGRQRPLPQSESGVGHTPSNLGLQDILAAASITSSPPNSLQYPLLLELVKGAAGVQQSSPGTVTQATTSSSGPVTMVTGDSPGDQNVPHPVGVPVMSNLQIPLFRMANGQIIATTGQLPSNQGLLNQTVVGISPEDIQTVQSQPSPGQSVPIQIVAQSDMQPVYPVELVSRVLENSSFPGSIQLIVPATSGSGSSHSTSVNQASYIVQIPGSRSGTSVAETGPAPGSAVVSVPLHMMQSLLHSNLQTVEYTGQLRTASGSEDTATPQEAPMLQIVDVTGAQGPQVILTGTEECHTENK